MSDGALHYAKRCLTALANALAIEPRQGDHKCPNHDDTQASLSIYQSEDGTWLWRCHAGCGGGSAVDALMLTKGITVNEAIRQLTKSSNSKLTRQKKRNLEEENARAREFSEILENDRQVAEYLRERRGISKEAALLWGVGALNIVRNNVGHIKSVTWSLPVHYPKPPHELLGIKLHRDPPLNNQSKGGWLVRGGSGFFPLISALRLPPRGRIILTPGELKALAYLSADLPAVGITTGENTRWTPKLAQEFAGLHVLIDRDREQSEPAYRFVENAVAALRPFVHKLEVAGDQS